VLSHPARDVEADRSAKAAGRYNQHVVAPMRRRTRDEVARFLDGLESPDPGWCRCTSGGRKPAIPWPRPPATRSSHGNLDSLKCPT